MKQRYKALFGIFGVNDGLYVSQLKFLSEKQNEQQQQKREIMTEKEIIGMSWWLNGSGA